MNEKLEMQVADLTFSVDNPAPFECSMTALPEETPGITKIEVTFTAPERSVPSAMSISWDEPMDQIHYKWNPVCSENRLLDITGSCRNSVKAKINNGAPVTCLHAIDGTNAITFALSDALRETSLGIRIGEYGAVKCAIDLFCEEWEPIQEYSVILRIDRRTLPYHRCLSDCVAWWDELIPQKPLPVPEGAKTARYCSWYTFHGKFTDTAIEKQCRLAKDLGMGTFGYEAGWASDKLDYLPDTRKLPDFRKHVDTIHSYGMKFVLWVAPSFINPVSAERFKDKLIGKKEGKRGALDARYPEVRQYIIDAYVRIVKDYDVDGFFFDFLPFFGTATADEPEDDARDCKSVSVGLDRLLRDVVEALQEIKPDLLMEFRQRFIGPNMRRYANMFRANDCGNCFGDNRIRTIDIRLLSGRSISHADPNMWNPAEPVESAAMQLTHTLFAVPQVSVDLEKLPKDHTEMVRTYIGFWNEHRDVILDGEFAPMEPQGAFPVVLASTADKFLAAVYATAVIPVPEKCPSTILIVNGTYYDHVVIEVAGTLGKRRLHVVSCTGADVCDREVELEAGLHRIDMPPNGYATLRLAE